MASQIPSIPYLISQYRICSSFQHVLREELLLLESELATGHITQREYDVAVADIERDIEHLATLRQSLSEIKQAQQLQEPA